MKEENEVSKKIKEDEGRKMKERTRLREEERGKKGGVEDEGR